MRYLLFFFAIAISACGKTSMAKMAPAEPQRYTSVREDADLEIDYEDDRLMIFDAYVDLKVKSAEGIADQIETLGKNSGGYLLERSFDRVRLRVPAESLDEVLTAIGDFGRIESQNVTGRDVTDQHLDLSLRLDNAKQARQRYLQLLDKAVNVSDILLIEKELERLQLQIERLQGQINRLDEQIAYSTITVRIEEKVKPGPLGWVFVGIGKAVKWLFVW